MGFGFRRFRRRTLTLTLQGLMFWPQRPSYRRLVWAVLLLRVKGKEPFHLIEVPEVTRSRTLLPYGTAKSKKDQKPFYLMELLEVRDQEPFHLVELLKIKR